MNSTRNLWVAVVVLAIIASGGYFFPQAKQLLGRVGTAFPNGLCTGTACTVDTAGKTQIGANGTEIGDYEFGACSPSFSSADLAATTTAIGICTDTTFTTSDSYFAMQKFTGATTGFGLTGGNGMFPAINVIATTSGQVGIQVINFTGLATTSVNQIYRTYSIQAVR